MNWYKGQMIIRPKKSLTSEVPEYGTEIFINKLPALPHEMSLLRLLENYGEVSSLYLTYLLLYLYLYCTLYVSSSI